MGIKCGALKTHVKALGAALSALWFIFKTLDAVEPVVDIVVCVNETDAMLFGKTNVLVLADFVFFDGMDVGVVEKNIVLDSACQHGLHDLARAGGTTGVQQYLAASYWQAHRGAKRIFDRWRFTHDDQLYSVRMSLVASQSD